MVCTCFWCRYIDPVSCQICNLAMLLPPPKVNISPAMLYFDCSVYVFLHFRHFNNTSAQLPTFHAGTIALLSSYRTMCFMQVCYVLWQFWLSICLCVCHTCMSVIPTTKHPIILSGVFHHLTVTNRSTKLRPRHAFISLFGVNLCILVYQSLTAVVLR